MFACVTRVSSALPPISLPLSVVGVPFPLDVVGCSCMRALSVSLCNPTIPSPSPSPSRARTHPHVNVKFPSGVTDGDPLARSPSLPHSLPVSPTYGLPLSLISDKYCSSENSAFIHLRAAVAAISSARTRLASRAPKRIRP